MRGVYQSNNQGSPRGAKPLFINNPSPSPLRERGIKGVRVTINSAIQSIIGNSLTYDEISGRKSCLKPVII